MRSSLEANIKRIEGRRAESLRATSATPQNLYERRPFDFELAARILRKRGYNQTVDEIDRYFSSQS